MRVRYTETTLVEIAEILAYIADRNPSAADRVAGRIARTLRHIAAFPRSSVQRADEPGSYVAVVGHFPYRVYYTIENDEVVVFSVRHAARRPL